MKSSTTDKVEGKFHEAVGQAKETLGNLTNDPKLEAEGQDEHLDGKIQKKIGQIKEVDATIERVAHQAGEFALAELGLVRAMGPTNTASPNAHH